MLVRYIAIIFCTLAENISAAWYLSPDYDSISSPIVDTLAPLMSLYYPSVNWPSRWGYEYCQEGRPCMMPWIPRTIGYCIRGRCRITTRPPSRTCDSSYNGEGYPTVCNATTCVNTPCIEVFTKPKGAHAGLCRNGECVRSSEL
ncbi:hypothetical protein MTO96_036100, partial [Rhipicephalus appendiculatus]